MFTGWGGQPTLGGAHAFPRHSRSAGTAAGAAGRTAASGAFIGALGSNAGITGKTASLGRWEDKEPQQAPDEGESEDGGSTYLVMTKVQLDVYGACFAIAMRGLRDERLGTILVSWIWVGVSIFLTLVVAFEVMGQQGSLTPGFNPFRQLDSLGEDFPEHTKERLMQALFNNTPMTKASQEDRALMHSCASQPSLMFILVVQFVWASRMMGQFKETRTLLSMLMSCPVRDMRSFTLGEVNGTVTIEALMPFDFLFFSLFLVVPKGIVAFLVWFGGARNLALADNFMDLLFRAVCQHYITCLESQVFANFVDHNKREWVSRVRVVQERNACRRILLSWPGEVGKLCLALLLLGITYLCYRNTVQIRDLCFQCVHSCPNTCVADFPSTCTNSSIFMTEPFQHFISHFFFTR